MSTPVVQEDSLGLSVRMSLTDPNDETEPLDLTGAAVVMIFLSPDGSTRLERTATIDGDPTLGNVVYLTVDGDLNEPGTWSVQCRMTYSASRVIRSEVAKLKVKANI